MNNKILHYMPDDKFIDVAIRQFEECGVGEHTFAVYNRESLDDIQYIKSIEKMVLAPFGSDTNSQLINDCLKGVYSAVIVHSWPGARFVEPIRKNLPVAVIPWGWEIYGFINKPLFLPKTARLKFSLRNGVRFWLRTTIARIKRNINNNRFYPLDRDLQCFFCMDYICSLIDTDYDLFLSKFAGFTKAKMLPFSYGCIDEYARHITGGSNDNNILLGNSANYEGNHIDVLNFLKRRGVKNKVLAPLNYGDRRYSLEISKVGNQILGDQFQPIEEFLPYQEYIKTIQGCRYMIMAHLRQQALGNIILGLWLGMKLFFVKGSPVYKYLVERGFKVFLLFNADAADFDVGLVESDVKKNKELVVRFWGKATVSRKTENLTRTLLARSRSNQDMKGRLL